MTWAQSKDLTDRAIQAPLNKFFDIINICHFESFSLNIHSFHVHVNLNTWSSTSCFKTTFTLNIIFFPKMFFLVMRTYKIHLIKILITAGLVCINDTNISCVDEGSLNIRCFLASEQNENWENNLLAKILFCLTYMQNNPQLCFYLPIVFNSWKLSWEPKAKNR